MRRCLFCYL